MIEINLVKKKQAFRLPTVLGVDLNKIRYSLLIIAYLFTYIPDWFIYPDWKKAEAVVESAINEKQMQLRKYKAKMKGQEDIKKELDAYNQQVEKIKSREALVEGILQSRSNPMHFMHHLAKNLPDDVWFTGLKMFPEKTIEITGTTLSYKSLGHFVWVANESIFFNKSIQLDKSENYVSDEPGVKGKQLIKFTLKGQVTRFE